MRYHLLFWLSCQILHLLVDGRVEAVLAARNMPGDVEPSTSPWTKLGEHYFELSSCSFSDADSQLDYFCYDPDGVYIENPDKLSNTFKISEQLCNHRRGLCRNVSLFLFKSQVAGLCISSSTRDLLQEFVVFGVPYWRYSPTCILPDSTLHAVHSVCWWI